MKEVGDSELEKEDDRSLSEIYKNGPPPANYVLAITTTQMKYVDTKTDLSELPPGIDGMNCPVSR